jgi:hypothetical protein
MNNCRHGHLVNGLLSFLILAAFLLAGCDRAPDGANIPRMDRLDLMTDLDMIVRCSDSSALVEAVAQSPLGQFWNSPQMAEFRNGKRLEEEIRLALADEADGENAAKIRDIYLEQFKMLDGEIILGLDFGDFEDAPAVTMVAAMTAADYERSHALDDLLFELEEVKTIKASEDFRGLKLYTYIRKEDNGDRFIYSAFHEGTVVTSDNRTWLEGALIQLMETPAREPEGDPVVSITGKARLIDQLQAVLAAQATEDDSPFDVHTMMRSLGIDALGDMDLNLCLKKDRTEMVFQVARRGEWNRGLTVLIPPEPAPADFRLAYIPEDVASYQVTRLDLNALWRQIPEILQQISPEFQMQFSMGVGAMGGMMNININEDLFNNLDRLAYSYACLDDEGQKMVYGLKVKDADAMERTLRKIFADNSPVVAQMGDYYHETDIQGQVIHALQFPMPTIEGDEPVYSEIGLTVVDRALVIGQGRMLEDYVQAAVHNQGAPGFYERRPFKEMMARLPANACSYGMSDLSAYARIFVKQVRQAAEQMESARATPASADSDGSNPLGAVFEGFNLAQLPPAEVIAGYLGTSDGYSVIDDAGFRSLVTIYYPKP